MICMWKQISKRKDTGVATERVINNRYFIELLIRATTTKRYICPTASDSVDGLYSEIVIEDERCVRTFTYLTGWAERPTIVDDEIYRD